MEKSPTAAVPFADLLEALNAQSSALARMIRQSADYDKGLVDGIYSLARTAERIAGLAKDGLFEAASNDAEVAAFMKVLEERIERLVEERVRHRGAACNACRTNEAPVEDRATVLAPGPTAAEGK